MSSIEPKFLDQLDDVVRRARRLQWAHGICGFLFVFLAAILLTSLLDYGFSIRDAGVRGVLSLCVFVLAVWACIKFVGPAWRYRPSRLDVALRVEKFFPTLGNRLSSAVAFVENADDHSAMYQLTIDKVASQIQHVTIQDALNRKPATRMFAWLFGGVLLFATLVLAAPGESRIALSRLAFPVAGPEWPRRHNLAWANAPEKIAEGQDVHFELTDRFGNNLPQEVWFQWKRLLPSGETESEVRLMTPTSENTLQTTFNNVLAPFEYRAFGGDDESLPWRKIEVVPAAAVIGTKVTVHPPEYTGFRPYLVEKPSVIAMIGSNIDVVLVLSRCFSSHLHCQVSSGHRSNSRNRIGMGSDAARDHTQGQDSVGFRGIRRSSRQTNRDPNSTTLARNRTSAGRSRQGRSRQGRSRQGRSRQGRAATRQRLEAAGRASTCPRFRDERCGNTRPARCPAC
jgi:hypothetical protein